MVLPVPEYREDDQHYDPMVRPSVLRPLTCLAYPMLMLPMQILDVVFEDVLAKFGGIIDPDRIYYAGYSAGCRGGIRWAVHEPYVRHLSRILTCHLQVAEADCLRSHSGLLESYVLLVEQK